MSPILDRRQMLTGSAAIAGLSLGSTAMKKRDEREAVELGRRLLGGANGGVGILSTERLDWGCEGVHVVHVRRAVTDRESARLPEWFLACPAIEMAGTRPLVL